MEAGNRCFDQRVPEELNRKVLDHLSDINLVLTEHARRYLIKEGINPETIIKTGSHMDEVLKYYMPKIEASDVLVREELIEGQYFVVSTHREENVDSSDNLNDLLESLNALAEKYLFQSLYQFILEQNRDLIKLKTLTITNFYVFLNLLVYLTISSFK